MKIGTRSPLRIWRIFFVCSLFAAFTIAVPALTEAQRLSTIVRPQHYTLALTPDLKAATFTGSETIDVTLAAPAGSITLNAHDLTFQSVEIETAGKKQKAIVSLDQEKQQATFTVPDK